MTSTTARTWGAAVAGNRTQNGDSDATFSLDDVFDRIPSAFAMIDTAGLFTRANPSFAELVGTPLSQLLGARWRRIIHPDDIPQCAAFVGEALRGGEERASLDVRVVRPDGGIRHVLLGAAVLRDTNGETVGFVGHFQDVTEEVRARHDKSVADDRLRTLFDRIPVALYRTALDGTILEGNQALADLLGVPNAEALDGFNAVDAYADPAERDRVVAMVKPDGVLDGEESELVRFDGRHIWVRDLARSVTEEGRVFFEGALVEVTDRREAQLELMKRARQQEILAQLGRTGLEITDIDVLLDNATRLLMDMFEPDYAGALSIEVDGTLEYRASSVEEELHRQVKELRPRSLAAVTLRTEDPVVIDDIETDPRFDPPDVLLGRGLKSGITVPIPSGNGVYGVLGAFWERRGAPGSDAGVFLQSVANVVGAAISRSRTQHSLEEAMRSKDDFIASVSHEVRTPLTVVSGMAQELAERWRSLDPQELDEFIALIADHSRDMSDLIDDLLVVARADMGRVSVSVDHVDLRDAAVAALAGVTKSEGHTVVIEPETVVAAADSTRVRQILRNVISNAFRYGGPNVSVACSRAGDRAVIEVRDDGAGPPGDDLEGIFEAYQRAPAASGQPSAVGLGLTVSRTLATLMGGSIVCRRDGDTVFRIELPAAV